MGKSKSFWLMMGGEVAPPEETISILTTTAGNRGNTDYVWSNARNETDGLNTSNNLSWYSVGSNPYSIYRCHLFFPKPNFDNVIGCQIVLDMTGSGVGTDTPQDGYLYDFTGVGGGTSGVATDFSAFTTQLSDLTAGNDFAITFTLNTAGVNYINNATGDVGFMVRSDNDVEDDSNVKPRSFFPKAGNIVTSYIKYIYQ